MVSGRWEAEREPDTNKLENILNIEELTLKQVKELQALLTVNSGSPTSKIGSQFIGACVLIRTYSAGVWCGRLDQKDGNEVILTGARRLWQFFAAQGISLSAVATHGVNQSKSRIATPVSAVWLEAIEIIPVTEEAEKSILGAEHAKAQ